MDNLLPTTAAPEEPVPAPRGPGAPELRLFGWLAQQAPSECKYLARQPVFDAQKNLFGYELLFRSGIRNCFDCSDPAAASCNVIADSALLHGLERLTGGHKAFINFPRQLLTSGVERFIPSNQLVVEIMEDIPAMDVVLAACQRMKEAGYTLALDDVTDCERPAEFLDLIDIIKVDVPGMDLRNQAEMVRRYAPRGVTLLAEKVEDHETFERLARLGYGLFQGYFFSKPEMISRRDIPAYKWTYLRLLQAIYRPQLDARELERIIKAEMALCYKLLRYLNSPVFGFRGEIRSVRHAITLLGEQKLRRWVTLLALASMGKDKPEELLISCLLRASWCESMAPKLGLKNREGDLFLLGLFSRIDAILDQPIAEILDQLPVASDIKEALAGAESPFGDVLQMVDTYEHADWDRSEELAQVLGVEKHFIPASYLKAMDWAHQVHRLTL